MFVSAVGCVYVVSGTPGNALQGAHRDSAQEVLSTAAASFLAGASDACALRVLMHTRPGLESASIHRPGRREVSIGHPGGGAERLVTPVEGGAKLALSYDICPARRLLDERNRMVPGALSQLRRGA